MYLFRLEYYNTCPININYLRQLFFVVLSKQHLKFGPHDLLLDDINVTFHFIFFKLLYYYILLQYSSMRF